MGRKPKSAKAEETNENSDPPLESTVDEQRSLSSLPSKKKLSTKPSPNMNAVIRRSGRVRNLQSPMSNQEMIVEEINLADSEKEQEPIVQHSNSEPHDQQLNSDPLVQQLNSEPISNLQKLEHKIDFLVQCVKELKSQGTKRPFQSETHSGDIDYQGLYIDSQKKIETLTEENHQLAKKLEFANGKTEAFEQMKDVFGNMARATEAVINFSSPAAVGKLSLPEATTTTQDAAPLAADEHNTNPPIQKKRGSKKKQI